ncbi:MAG: dynamin family protein [Candidatus Marinimicrobia bacterium]|nr:dynamin family protein [Candidatus Neomarinimicrobiota bacterium]
MNKKVNSNNIYDFDKILELLTKFKNYSKNYNLPKRIELNFLDKLIRRYKKLLNEYNQMKKRGIPLRIGIVGEFSAGKSSLINSLIGDEILGTNINPTTSIISKLKYGKEKKFVAVKDSKKKYINQETYDKLSSHINKNGSQNKKIDHFEIFYPNKKLKQFEIFDTPGYNSIKDKDNNHLKKFIKVIDVFIIVISVEKGITNKDIEFLNNGFVENKKVIAIINKTDLKPPSSVNKIMTEIGGQFNFYRLQNYSAKKILENIESQKFQSNMQYLNLTNMLKELKENYESIKENTILEIKSELDKELKTKLTNLNSELLKLLDNINTRENVKKDILKKGKQKLKSKSTRIARNISRNLYSKIKHAFEKYIIIKKTGIFRNKCKIEFKHNRDRVNEKKEIKDIILNIISNYYPKGNNPTYKIFQEFINEYNIDINSKFQRSLYTPLLKIFETKNRQCIIKKIKCIISIPGNMNHSEIYMNSTIYYCGVHDSLDVEEIINQINYSFNIPLNEQKVKNMKKVKDIVNYLDKEKQVSGRFFTSKKIESGYVVLPDKVSSKKVAERFIKLHINHILPRKKIQQYIKKHYNVLFDEIKKCIEMDFKYKKRAIKKIINITKQFEN